MLRYHSTVATFANGVRVLAVLVACTSSDPAKVVFVTRSDFPGNLGLVGADSKCSLEASAAALGGTFRAWLSDSHTSAIDRITGAGPWAMVDGTLVFNNKASLQVGPIVGVSIDEYGADVTPGTFGIPVWTGTLQSGQASMWNCNDWTSSSCIATRADLTGSSPNPNIGSIGAAGRTSSDWTFGSPCYFRCDTTARLYCFEQ